MPFKKEIVDQLQAGQARSRTIAHDIAAGASSIVAVALVGAWARGVVSPVDMDFVVVVADRRELAELAKYLQAFKKASPHQLSLFYHTVEQLESLVGRSQSTSIRHALVHPARVATRKLRAYPRAKQVLLRVLASWLPFIHLYEISAPNLQTWMPVYDPDNLLSRLQQAQRAMLANRLSPLERTFWSPNGFYALLEEFLNTPLDKEAVREVLARCDVDWQEYLRRCVTYYDVEAAAKIQELYDYLIR